MSDKERLVRFELLGQEHAFYTAAPEEEMESILTLVRNNVGTDSPNIAGTLPVSKVAVLACLNIASLHVKLEQEFEEYKHNSQSRIGRLNEEIRAKLSAE